jgi:hypothetical protein
LREGRDNVREKTSSLLLLGIACTLNALSLVSHAAAVHHHQAQHRPFTILL